MSKSSRTTVAEPGTGRGTGGGPALWTVLWAIGLVLLAVAAVGALLLSLHEVAANFNLPGCGESSGCADIKNAEVFGVKVGMVPGVGWPVAYVGFAFFAGMLAAWVASWRGRAGPGRAVTGLAFAGGVASVFFLGVMVIAHKFCVYCFTVHVANLLFVGVVSAWMMWGRRGEVGARAESAKIGASGRGALLAGAAVFVVCAAALGVADATAGQKAEAARAKQRAEARQEIIDRAHGADTGGTELASGTGEAGENAGTDQTGTPAHEDPSALTSAAEGQDEPDPVEETVAPSHERFAGRWEMGPEKAPIRIVMFMDYQCELCGATEDALVPMVEQSDDIWLSVKHYPACTDCNHFISRTMHSNACWAARAAETAGALGGEEAFWKMHKWLFARQGKFETNAVLAQGIAAAGITDVAGFMEYFMDESRSLPNVEADIEEAYALGLTQTPMVFINGVELRGMSKVSQLMDEIEALRAAKLPALTAAADRPPTAAQKYLEMWEAGRDYTPESTLTVSEADWSMGSAAPEVEIVMWGDYKFASVPEIDRAVRELVGEYDWTRYTFRLYPLERSCNEYLPERPLILEGACRTAQVAEAAGQVAGDEGFWKMHEWLMANSEKKLGDFMTKFAAEKAGLDGDAVVAATGKPEVAAAIAEDAMRKQALDPANRMPLLFVNGKVVTTDRGEDMKEVLRGILLEARNGR